IFAVNPPHTALKMVIPLYICPVDGLAQSVQQTRYGKEIALTSYLGVNGTDLYARDGVLYADSKVALAHIPDGSSNTLLAGERPATPPFEYGWWYGGIGQEDTGSLDGLLGSRERNRLRDLLYAPCGL